MVLSSLAGLDVRANVCPAKLSCVGYHCGCMHKVVKQGPSLCYGKYATVHFPGQLLYS